MRIIPVVDLKDGQVVHAVRGERQKYKPIHSISVLCNSSHPIDVAKAYEQELDLEELYIADLDAITSKGNNFEKILEIKEKTNLSTMVDAGVNSLQKAFEILKFKVDKIIIATETLTKSETIEKIAEAIGKKIVVSIDLKNGKILSKSPELRKTDVISLAVSLDMLGIGEIIILELSWVGSQKGIHSKRILQKLIPQINTPIITGGGIKDINDIYELKRLDVSGILVATALHKGNIIKKDLESFFSKR